MLRNISNISNISNIVSITNPDYDFLNVKNFFGGAEDPFRLIINIYAFISFLLNLIVVITVCYYKKNKEYSFSGVLTWNILFVNFIHTISFMLNWIIKNKDTEVLLYSNKSNMNIGALLTGNPNNFSTCIVQGFLLIVLSMSQDIIINIFIAYVNEDGKEKKPLFIMILIFLGYIFPISFTVFYYYFRIIGINEKYCYVSKYIFEIKEGFVKYKINNNYNFCKGIIFLIRGLNFLLTLFFIIRAASYIRRKEKSDKKTEKLKSSLPIVVITFFTLSIEIIFRIISFISSNFEKNFIGIYLILSNVDSFLLPFAFLIEHNIYKYWFCAKAFKYDDKSIDNESTIKDLSMDGLLPDKSKYDKK